MYISFVPDGYMNRVFPFHSIDNDGFKQFVEAVGKYGPGYRPPSQYQLREPLLKEQVERTKGLLKKQEEDWAQNGCSVISPLVKVLRLVDGDPKPSMGFLYGELKQAKEDIKMAFNNVENNYRSIIDIIDTKAKGRLDSPLHMMAYLLNPYYFFKDQEIKDNVMVSDIVFICIEKFFLDDNDKQDQVINMELPKYKEKEGDFGRMLAAKGCSENNSSYDPGTWWMTYGNSTPTLQKMAIKILSLTTSSSGCERNWSAFEGIHTKKRNRLDSQRLHDLVYVQFNSKLINKWARVKNQNADVLCSLDASMAQSCIVAISDDDEEMEEGGGLENGGEEIDDESATQEDRELHEDDFVSDAEQVEGDEYFEFNSDEEGFLE
ncbi:unnamed protein product [Lactuca virosa]|uniref:HAT C-terminal dimerisation domain-containing protein n=1 Tax=Lactuca virosa TaxID=75947 RepID=A0AAU9M2Q1_9ASTR|nr:unnamed protein product [Lactuca virosa]